MHFIVDITNEEIKKPTEMFWAPTQKQDKNESSFLPVVDENRNYSFKKQTS